MSFRDNDPLSEGDLTRLEIEHTIAILRRCRDNFTKTRLELQERQRAGVAAIDFRSTTDAVIAASNEIALLSTILAKLWEQLRKLEPGP